MNAQGNPDYQFEAAAQKYCRDQLPKIEASLKELGLALGRVEVDSPEITLTVIVPKACR